MSNVMVICEHLSGKFSDITFEMLDIANGIGDVTAVTFGSMSGKVGELGVAGSVINAGCENEFNPESYAAATQAAIEASSPDLVLVASTSMGYDIGNPIAANLNIPLIGYCTDIRASSSGHTFTSSLYGGKMSVTSESTGTSIAMVLAGVGSADSGRVSGSPSVSEVSASNAGKVRFKQLILPDDGDVDITQSEIIIAIGRGIGGKDDIEVAEELAEVLDADIACSRPLVDAGWLPKSRQVGKSGMKVKPKLYIALGISGAPEHIEGMKDSTTIIAINSDENAPIFDVAHYGMTEDLFDVVEELIEELE